MAVPASQVSPLGSTQSRRGPHDWLTDFGHAAKVPGNRLDGNCRLAKYGILADSSKLGARVDPAMVSRMPITL